MARGVLIPVDLLNDIAVIKLGHEGFGIYVSLLQILTTRNGEPIPFSDKKAVASMLRITPEKLTEVLEICIETALLCATDVDFWDDKVLEDSQAYLHRCAINADNATRKKSKKRKTSESLAIRSGNAEAKAKRFHVTVTDTVTVNNSREIAKPDPELSKGLELWKQYRKQFKKPLTDLGVKQILKAYEGRSTELLRDVEHSIKCGFQGLFPPKETSTAPPRHAQNVINNQRTLATMKKFEELEKYENNGDVENIIEGLLELPTSRTR